MKNPDKIICVAEHEGKRQIALFSNTDMKHWRIKGLKIREANGEECTELFEKILSGFPCYSLLYLAR